MINEKIQTTIVYRHFRTNSSLVATWNMMLYLNFRHHGLIFLKKVLILGKLTGFRREKFFGGNILWQNMKPAPPPGLN